MGLENFIEECMKEKGKYAVRNIRKGEIVYECMLLGYAGKHCNYCEVREEDVVFPSGQIYKFPYYVCKYKMKENEKERNS